MLHFSYPSCSPSISPSSSWSPQVSQQLSQHALLSRCGSEPSHSWRYGTQRGQTKTKHIFILFVPVCLISHYSPPAPFSAPVSSPSVPSPGPDIWGYDPRPRALSVIAVRPELDTLYKQMQTRGEGPPTEAGWLEPLGCVSPVNISLSLSFCYVISGLPLPHDRNLFSLSPGAHNQHDFSTFNQPSPHAFQQYQLGGISEGHSLHSDSGLMPGRPLWDTENFVQPVGGYSGHQTGSSQAGVTHLF